jgi:hypothetical protein
VWLYLPSSISASLPVPADSISLSDSQAEMLSASATWRTMPRRPAFWRHEWKRGTLTLLRSGVTCEPSRASSIVTAWLESLGAFPVPISPWQDEEKESAKETEADSGTNTSASFAEFAPCGCLLKTFQPSSQPTLFDALSTEAPLSSPFSGRLPKNGAMRNGVLLERPTLKPHIDGSGSSSSPGNVNGGAKLDDAESRNVGI